MDEIYAYVGARIRERRLLAGLALAWLAGWLGVTEEQVEGFETGRLPINTTQLFAASRALNVPIRYFFEGYKSDRHCRSDLPTQS